jgi:hypothetical protein
MMSGRKEREGGNERESWGVNAKRQEEGNRINTPK